MTPTSHHLRYRSGRNRSTAGLLSRMIWRICQRRGRPNRQTFWRAEDGTRPATYEPSERRRGGSETHMFSNILIQTDGSDFPAEAVEQGVLFAKEIGAKITAMTVTEPFHLLSVSPANSNTRRSNTRSTRRLRPTKCSVSFRLRPSQQVSSAIRFTSNTNSSFRRSSKPPKRESAI